MEIKYEEKPDHRERVETIVFGTCIEFENSLYIVTDECPGQQCAIVSLKYGKRKVVEYGTLAKVVSAFIQVEQ